MRCNGRNIHLNCLIPDSHLYKYVTNVFLIFCLSGWDLFFSSGPSSWSAVLRVFHGWSPATTLVRMNWYTLEDAGIELAGARPFASWENLTWPANVWFTCLESHKTTTVTDLKLLNAVSWECHTLNVSIPEIFSISRTALTLSQSEMPTACQSLGKLIFSEILLTPFPISLLNFQSVAAVSVQLKAKLYFIQ